MGSAGSIEQSPATIIVTPAKAPESNNNIASPLSNNKGSSSLSSTFGSPVLGGATSTRIKIEYIGVWEYKLSSSSSSSSVPSSSSSPGHQDHNTDGTFFHHEAEDESESEGWTCFAASDQERLESVFAKKIENNVRRQEDQDDDDDKKNVMIMVGRTAWNVDLNQAKSSSNHNNNQKQSNSKAYFKMSRGSGHLGVARRRNIEKPDVHAPSPFDDVDNNTNRNKNNNLNASRNLYRNALGDDEGEDDGTGNLNELAETVDDRFEVYLNSTIKAHNSLVYCIDFSRDGQKVLSGSRDGTFRYWEMGSSRVACDYQRITDGVILSCAIAPNNKFAVSGSSNTKAYLWSTEKSHERATGENNQFQKPIEVLDGHTHKVYGAQFTSDSALLVTGAMDHSVRTWDVARAVPVRKIVPHTAAVFTIAASRNTPHLALSGADDHLLVAHDLRTANEKGVGVYRGHKATIWASDIRHDDGLFVSAGMDGACLLWDPRNGSRPLQHVGDHGVYPVHCAEFLPEGNFVVTSARDSTFRIWDINVPTSKAEVPNNVPTSVFDPEIKYPCCRDLCKVTAHQGNVFKIAFESIRNKIMTCGSDGLIKIWDLKQKFQ